MRVRKGKGGKERLVTLNDAAERAIREYLDLRPEDAWILMGNIRGIIKGVALSINMLDRFAYPYRIVDLSSNPVPFAENADDVVPSDSAVFLRTITLFSDAQWNWWLSYHQESMRHPESCHETGDFAATRKMVVER